MSLRGWYLPGTKNSMGILLNSLCLASTDADSLSFCDDDWLVASSASKPRPSPLLRADIVPSMASFDAFSLL